MVTISLCMIVRNEENTLGHCLESVKDIVDEMIIVDTGSTDKTKEIAYKYTDKVYDFEWIDDFAAARNYSFSKATQDFILWLDADDVFLEEDQQMLRYLKSDLNLQFDTVMMKYVVSRDESGKELMSIYRERMVRRGKNYQWHDPIHEYLNYDGVILHTEITVTHTKEGHSSERNLKILKDLLSTASNISPRHIFYYAGESQNMGDTQTAIDNYEKFLDMEGEADAHYVQACFQLSQMYLERNEQDKAFRILIRSFEYGPMRAEILTSLGMYYRELKDYHTAISWLELALSLEKPKLMWHFFSVEYWDFLPLLELCHCYYMIGNISKSIEFHERSKMVKPYHPFVIENERFFANVNLNP